MTMTEFASLASISPSGLCRRCLFLLEQVVVDDCTCSEDVLGRVVQVSLRFFFRSLCLSLCPDQGSSAEQNRARELDNSRRTRPSLSSSPRTIGAK